jgi:hypothetical protein
MEHGIRKKMEVACDCCKSRGWECWEYSAVVKARYSGKGTSGTKLGKGCSRCRIASTKCCRDTQSAITVLRHQNKELWLPFKLLSEINSSIAEVEALKARVTQ